MTYAHTDHVPHSFWTRYVGRTTRSSPCSTR